MMELLQGTNSMRTHPTEIPQWLELTFSADARDRRKALQALCPCEVKSNNPEVWRRVLELIDDPDEHVRRWVVHVLCDGSPTEYRAEIVDALRSHYHDRDDRVRKAVRKVLAEHRRSGNVNIL